MTPGQRTPGERTPGETSSSDGDVGAAAIEPDIRARIDRRLDAIERDEGARILFAVESGSRAWGFPSPDSDYDARFVYVRPIDWYLSIAPGRDVIETPIEGIYDVNGWCLRKALGLVLRSNSVLLEWLTSPIVYRERAGVRAALTAFCREAMTPMRMRWHYLRLAERQIAGFGDAPDSVPLKRFFYALRPAIALDWLARHGEAPDRTLPMAIGPLLDETEAAPALRSWVDALNAKKRETRELGAGKPPDALVAYIDAQLAAARGALAAGRPEPKEDHRAEADALFRALLCAHAPESDGAAAT